MQPAPVTLERLLELAEAKPQFCLAAREAIPPEACPKLDVPSRRLRALGWEESSRRLLRLFNETPGCDDLLREVAVVTLGSNQHLVMASMLVQRRRLHATLKPCAGENWQQRNESAGKRLSEVRDRTGEGFALSQVLTVPERNLYHDLLGAGFGYEAARFCAVFFTNHNHESQA